MSTGIACLGDLWPTDDGMIVVGEDIADGAIMHISEVTRGLGCDCICMGCRRRLVAKKGEARLRTHHFAHHFDGTADCISSGESRLHLHAKRIIERHGIIGLPAVEITDHRGKTRIACRERVIALNDIRLEQADGDIVPDIVAIQPDGRRIFIEVCNFHKCSPEKLRALRNKDVDVLEIYVSGYRGALLTDLDDPIIHSAPRKLLQSRAADLMQERIDRERQADQDRVAARIDQLVAAYRHNEVRSHRSAEALVAEFVDYGCGDLLDLDDSLPSAFIVHRRQWQSAILFRLLDVDARNTVYVLDMLKRFDERKWVKPALAHMKSLESRQITATVAEDFRSPFEQILGYLQKLEAAGVVVQQSKHGFSAKMAWLRQIRDAVQDKEDAAERLSEVEGLFADIGEMMNRGDGELPDAKEWLAGKAAAVGLSFDQFMRDNESGVCEIIDDLRKLSKAVGSPTADAPEQLVTEVGLPLEALMWRVRAEFYERVERQGAIKAGNG